MNKYQFGQVSQTFHTVMIYGMIASLSSPINEALQLTEPTDKTMQFAKDTNYYSINTGTPQTYEPKTHILNNTSTSNVDIEFEQAVSDFYETLLAEQESLGAEFEQVLADNLWELYQS